MVTIPSVEITPEIVVAGEPIEISISVSWQPLTYGELKVARYLDLKGYEYQSLKGGVTWKAKTYLEIHQMTYADLKPFKFSEIGSGVIQL